MRNPVRSETDAFRIAFGGAVIIGASATLATLVNPVAGAALFAGAIGGAVAWQFATTDPERHRPLREAALIGRRTAPGERPRVLVVANRTLGDEELRELMRDRAAAGAEIRIVAPILVSRARYIASDVDRELSQARGRVEAALAWAAAEGIPASGKVGDPNAALGAIEDELRLYAAEEVIVSTLALGRSNWLETGIVERLRDELEIPVTHIVGAAAAAPVPAQARRPAR
jgi:GABA permease